MAVVFDAVGPSSAGQSATATTTTSWSHTCTGPNLLLIVGVAVGTPAGGTTSVTYNSVAMTSVSKKLSNNVSTTGYIEMFSLVAPASGANTVQVTQTVSAGSISAGSVSFIGVDQTTPLGTPATAFGAAGTTVAVTVPGTTPGNMVIDAACVGSSFTADTQTLRWRRNTNNTSSAGNGCSSTAAAGGSVTLSHTAGLADNWADVGVEVLAAIPREPVALTHVGSTTWVTPASSAAVAPTYPSGLADATATQTDMVYAVLHIKPDTATVATPSNWELVGAASGGSGTQAADTGASRVHVYRRTATAALSGTTQSFTITGGSSPAGVMRAYRATGTNVAFTTETTTSWSVTTGSTTIGGTASAGLSLAALDDINCVLGSPSDAATTLTLTGLTATGATLGSLTRDPNATAINAQGNDSSATAYRIPVTAGTSTSAPVATATSNTSVTAVGFLFRVRATAEVAPLWLRRRGPNYRR